MRPFLTPAVLSAALLLGACSGTDPDPPVELPEPPPGVEHLDDAAIETQLGAVLGAVSETSGTPVEWEALFDVTDGGLEELVDHYDTALTAEGWELGDGPTDIAGPLGASWRRDGQSVVLLTLQDLEGRDLAMLLPPTEEQS